MRDSDSGICVWAGQWALVLTCQRSHKNHEVSKVPRPLVFQTMNSKVTSLSRYLVSIFIFPRLRGIIKSSPKLWFRYRVHSVLLQPTLPYGATLRSCGCGRALDWLYFLCTGDWLCCTPITLIFFICVLRSINAFYVPARFSHCRPKHTGQFSHLYTWIGPQVLR